MGALELGLPMRLAAPERLPSIAALEPPRRFEARHGSTARAGRTHQ